MDKLILGLLMLNRLTVYEIRMIIKKNFWGICSDSMGSIQAAIKKLLAAGMVEFEEYVEKSVNKKRYSITAKGREAFQSWVETPAEISSATNMELGKLLFMGLMPAAKQEALIDEIIADEEKELKLHLKLQEDISIMSYDDAHQALLGYWKQDPEYHKGVQAAIGSEDDIANINSIVRYQELTLQYGIDYMKFNIEWFKKLKGANM